MNKLTIVASNRDRFDLNSNATKWFLKSLEAQTNKNFELILADGGSANVDEIKKYFKNKDGIKMSVVELPLGKEFERSKLNNVGVRNAKTPYALTTDVDMFFCKNFVKTILEIASPKIFIESRTLYWKPAIAQRIYKGILDPINDIEHCKIGRIKKRTSAGGCQCMHVDSWSKLKGFNEALVGWGSEDVELLKRAKLIGLKVLWMGEKDDVMVFHQPHPKPDLKNDLECQGRNKRIFSKSTLNVNNDGWGGIYE